MNSYKLSRNFVDFSFENPSIIKPNHYALYFFSIEHCNRLGWKKEFGLPTTMTMEAIGIKSYNTYINTFNDLIKFGFFKIVERSKNQYSSNIIELSNFDKTLDNALDKAFIKHATKQSESTIQSTGESIDSINKPINNKQINQLNNNTATPFSFFNSLVSLGVDKELANDWIKVRKTKKLTNTKTAFKNLKIEFKKANMPINDIIEKCIIESWGGFKSSWLSQKTETKKINGKEFSANFEHPDKRPTL